MPSPSAPAPGDPLTPEQVRVLRSAVAEYQTGHKSDLAAAKDPATTYTSEDRAEYQRALQEHYTAVRAYIQAQAKENTDDVRP